MDIPPIVSQVIMIFVTVLALIILFNWIFLPLLHELT